MGSAIECKIDADVSIQENDHKGYERIAWLAAEDPHQW